MVNMTDEQRTLLRAMTDFMAEVYRDSAGIPDDLAVDVEVAVHCDGGVTVSLHPEWPCGAPLRRFGGELPARPYVDPEPYLAVLPSGAVVAVDPERSEISAVDQL